MIQTLPLQLGIPGGPELLVILLIAVLLFGANKIPKLARSTGEAMGEFQKGREEVEQELQEMREGATPGDDTETGTTTDTAAETTGTDVGNPETTAAESTTTEGGDEEFDIADAETEEETN
ncbi:twin-arginine translocase TatA/TatE family subunit [Natronomonas salina]|uniref:twin-arginine translocase TatA/TatE family subunit n=1 Tax=Natronomonas salina TaxID=1710540 RepID=UPI0015B5942F|nr:twin-arginine translocase TatA/TatE family subunit [Natronomonas salina]QLD87516.1 twin-arginine translocase TatA/TatE family subunit [Natronomonas salina]